MLHDAATLFDFVFSLGLLIAATREMFGRGRQRRWEWLLMWSALMGVSFECRVIRNDVKQIRKQLELEVQSDPARACEV